MSAAIDHGISGAYSAAMNLADYLVKHGITQSVFAERIGCTQGRVSQLMSGGLPSMSLAARIHDVTGGQVSFRDWPTAGQPTEEKVA